MVTGATPQTTVKNKVSGEIINGVGYQGGLNFGIYGILGAEFFITKELSLGAEYQLGYSVLSQYNQESTTPPAATVTTKEGTINSAGIASTGYLTLSFYF